jgi:hypothetical protein
MRASNHDDTSPNVPSSSSSGSNEDDEGQQKRDMDSASSASPFSPDDLEGSLASLFEGLRGGIQGEVGGSAEVQDALDTVMQMSVRKAQVKEDILADLETKKERLRVIGEELTEEFGREIEMDKARAELASNMSLSETLERFQQVEDEVQAVRDQLLADKRDLEEWEDKQAASRNQGLFFQKLYKVKGKGLRTGPDEQEGDGRWADRDEEENEIRARSIEKVKKPAKEEVSNPWRSWIYLYLCAVLLLVMAQDLVDAEAPSYALDALYGGLAALMGFTSWRERQSMDE